MLPNKEGIRVLTQGLLFKLRTNGAHLKTINLRFVSLPVTNFIENFGNSFDGSHLENIIITIDSLPAPLVQSEIDAIQENSSKGLRQTILMPKPVLRF